LRIEADYRAAQHPAVMACMTLLEFIQGVYLRSQESGWATSTRVAVRSALKRHVLHLLGPRSLTSILKNDIVTRLNEMRAAGYAKRSIGFVRWLLYSVFEEAIYKDLVSKTPVRRIPLKNIPDSEETRPLSEDEVRRVFNAAEGKARLCWRLLIGCGLRPGELSALGRNDVISTGLRVDEAYESGELAPQRHGPSASCHYPPA
jgi:integrase